MACGDSTILSSGTGIHKKVLVSVRLWSAMASDLNGEHAQLRADVDKGAERRSYAANMMRYWTKKTKLTFMRRKLNFNMLIKVVRCRFRPE